MLLYIILLSLGLYIGGTIYYCLTLNEKDIIVKKKYTKTINGKTTYVLIDNQGDIYKIDTCIWIFHFDKKDVWNKIIEGKKCKITIYGLRIKDLNMLPNIINII